MTNIELRRIEDGIRKTVEAVKSAQNEDLLAALKSFLQDLPQVDYPDLYMDGFRFLVALEGYRRERYDA